MTEQGTVLPRVAPGSEEQALLKRLRAGEDAAFGELFELHAAAVRRLAMGLANDSSEAEDITAETFFRVLQALRRGAGPKDHVRAYLLTVARRVSWEWHGARRDVPVSDDELTHRAGAGGDALGRTAEHNLITAAFTSLPERWRTVLWQTEVEGEQPAVVAPHFGLSANATAALARRARLGLRAAYLQAHLAVNRTYDGGCRSVMEKLGGYTAGSVTGAEARRIRSHLLGCSSCRSMHAELSDVCSSLRAHAGVLVLAVPASGLAIGSVSGAGSSGASSGLAATVKGVLLGSKMKVGVALASTAAAGVFGIAVGPAVLDSDASHPMSLPGRGGDVELRIAVPPNTPPVAPSSSPPGADHNVLRFPGVQQRDSGAREHTPQAANAVPALPGTTVSRSDTTKPESPGTGKPRMDTTEPDSSQAGGTMSSTGASSSGAQNGKSGKSGNSGKPASSSGYSARDDLGGADSGSTTDTSGSTGSTEVPVPTSWSSPDHLTFKIVIIRIY